MKAQANKNRSLGRNRQPLQQRSMDTQRRLVEGAIAALVELGYARLTTAAISRHAGVSEGALFVHFPSKADLVVAAVERVFADLEERYRRLLARNANDADPLATSVRALWQVMARPEYLATNEVYLAARTDRVLGAAIRPMARRHQENLMRAALELHGDRLPAGPADLDVFDTAVLAIQGAVIDSVALGDRGLDEHRLTRLQQFVRRVTAGPAAPARRPKRSSS